MAITSGYSDQIVWHDGSTNKTILTIGDFTKGESRTAISIKTRASEYERFIPGMAQKTLSFTVLKGTDPADASAVDGYQAFKSASTNKTTMELSVMGDRNTWYVTQFEETSPIDGVSSASVTLSLASVYVSPSSNTVDG